MADDEFAAKVGTALLIPSGPQDKNHLYFVLTEKCVEENHLLVSISTVPERGFYDATCILEPGDHPFILHQSFVFYRTPQVYSASKIARFVRLKYFQPKEDSSPELIQRICAGILTSSFTPRFHQRYFEAQQA
jgi:hypothetical protein